ncbi:cupin [Microtetraspora sp. NBRC 13810]|uniref:cupin domain-containing protein n=1 Tax=Microtetraspora sp. NBRC 13810 TaxID=3030990 RepID=UPI0024A27972|nr:cupin domain-containing protein [Microtetraspora sp. NBRC 13810]GLW12316.1 cupin [Microtetraspora sp. NBRC 13810]
MAFFGRPYVCRAGEGEALWFFGGLTVVKATGAETRGALTVAEFVSPPGFAPPLHRHRLEDELFYVLAGTAVFHCAGEILPAGPGDFALLPVGLAHTFVTGPGEPLRALQITAPPGFERFAAAVGEPARERTLPPPGTTATDPVTNPVALGHTAARHGIDILGPPPPC